jgi:hypothetical protein
VRNIYEWGSAEGTRIYGNKKAEVTFRSLHSVITMGRKFWSERKVIVGCAADCVPKRVA